jgi:tubulin beta
LSDIRAQDGKYLTTARIYRGQISTEEIDEPVAKVACKMYDDFVSWIPNNNKCAVIDVPPTDTPISATFLANTTAIKSVFQRNCSQFAKMYKRKAFVHWYAGEGMDEMEFQEADKNVRDLTTEYQDKQDAVVDDCSDEEYR